MIWAVGVGPGDPELLTLRAKRLIGDADVVAAFASSLNVVAEFTRRTTVKLTYANQTEALAAVAAAHHEGRRCVVGFMGDPSVSGRQLLARVERACGHPVEVVPGISVVQVVAARAGLALDETVVVSFHKRGKLEPDQQFLLAALASGRPAIVLPRPWDFMPAAIGAFLLARDVCAQTPVSVWERLTMEEGNWRGDLRELAAGAGGRVFGDMSVVVIGGEGNEALAR